MQYSWLHPEGQFLENLLHGRCESGKYRHRLILGTCPL
jgi:hypothetical protein